MLFYLLLLVYGVAVLLLVDGEAGVEDLKVLDDLEPGGGDGIAGVLLAPPGQDPGAVPVICPSKEQCQ